MGSWRYGAYSHIWLWKLCKLLPLLLGALYVGRWSDTLDVPPIYNVFAAIIYELLQGYF